MSCEQTVSCIDQAKRLDRFHRPTMRFKAFTPGTWPEYKVLGKPVAKFTMMCGDKSVP